MTKICGHEISEADEGILYACCIATEPRKDSDDQIEHKYDTKAIKGIIREILERMKSGSTATTTFNCLHTPEIIAMYRNTDTFVAQVMHEQYGKHIAWYLAEGSELFGKYVEYYSEQKKMTTKIGTICDQDISEASEGVIYACSIQTDQCKGKNGKMEYKYNSSDIKNIIAEILEPKEPGITTTVAFGAYRTTRLVQKLRQPTSLFAQGMKHRHGNQMLRYQARGSELFDNYHKRPGIRRVRKSVKRLDNDDRDYDDDNEDQSIGPMSQSMYSMALSAPVEPQGLRSNTQGGSTPSLAGSLARQNTTQGSRLSGPPFLPSQNHDPFHGSRVTLPTPPSRLPPPESLDTSINSASQQNTVYLPFPYTTVKNGTNPRSSLYLQPRYPQDSSLAAIHGDIYQAVISKEHWNPRVQRSAYAPLSNPDSAPPRAPILQSESSQAAPEDTPLRIGDSLFRSMQNYLGPQEQNSCSSRIWIGHNKRNYGAPGADRSPSPHALRNYAAWLKDAKAEQKPYRSKSSSPPLEGSAPPHQRRRAAPEDTPLRIGDSSFRSMKKYLGPEEQNSCSSKIWIGHNKENYGAPGADRSPSPHALRNYAAWLKGAKAEQQLYRSKSSSPPSEGSAPPPQRRRMPDGGGQERAGERQRYVATGRRDVGSAHGQQSGESRKDRKGGDQETAHRGEGKGKGKRDGWCR